MAGHSWGLGDPLIADACEEFLDPAALQAPSRLTAVSVNQVLGDLTPFDQFAISSFARGGVPGESRQHPGASARVGARLLGGFRKAMEISHLGRDVRRRLACAGTSQGCSAGP